MRYTIKEDTLIVNGEFEALSSGINGGRRGVTTLFNHTINPDLFNHAPPERYTERVADKHGILPPYFGLLTAVKMEYLQIIRDEYLTAFITAGITNPSPFRIRGQEITHTQSREEITETIGTINIILVADATLSEEAMASAIITATEAKGLALLKAGCNFLGTTTDAIIIAYEKNPTRRIKYAGTCTEFGEKITEAIIRGVKKPRDVNCTPHHQ